MVFVPSNVVTSHIVPACVKELSLSGGCVGQNRTHKSIHSLYLALADTDMFDNVQQFSPARGDPYNVRDGNLGL